MTVLACFRSALSRICSAPTRWLAAGAAAYLAFLTVFSCWVGDEFPFSHFPMYGNPNNRPVDYCFLTDAQGNPLSCRDYAGITTPQIKKRLNTLLGKARLLDESGGLTEAARDKAAGLLQRMRDDAAASPQKLLQWPAGTQMKLGLILTETDGFREEFHTLAALADAGPPTRGDAAVLAADVQDSAQGMIQQTGALLGWYAWALGLVLAAMALRSRLPERWRAFLFTPAEGGLGLCWLEAFAIRFGLAAVLWSCLQNRVDYDALPHPAGLARFFPQAALWFGDAGHWAVMLRWAQPLLVWYVLGIFPLLPVTALTIIHCLARSLYASQGAPHHGQNMVALVFLAQAVACWWQAGAWGLASLRGRRLCPWPRPRWMLQLLLIAATIGAAYVITFVTKMDKSGGKWMSNSPYFSNQIVKTCRQNYYNDLNPRYLQGVPQKPAPAPDPANDRYRHPVPAQSQWLITHTGWARLFFCLGLAVEATAFLVLLGRGFQTFYGLAIISFHVMVLFLMELTFPENVVVVAVTLVNLPGWLLAWQRRRLGSPGSP